MSEETDIVERLLTYIPLASYDGVVLTHIAIFKEAAAEITRLRPRAGWREAIRKLAIKKVDRLAYGGGVVYTGWTCELCKGDWEKDETEQHAPDCLATIEV